MIDADDKWPIAYHEAGHAVANAVLGGVGSRVTILEKGEELGSAQVAFTYDDPLGEEALTAHIIIDLAGYVSQVRYAPHDEEGAMAGAKRDFEGVQRLISLRGKTLSYWFRRTKTFVEENWSSIQAVAEALIQCGELSPDEVDIVMSVSQSPGSLASQSPAPAADVSPRRRGNPRR